MSFITQGKANLKYILIVVILAAIVGGGILAYQYYFQNSGSSPLETTTPTFPQKNQDGQRAIDSANAFLKALQTDNFEDAKKWSLVVENEKIWQEMEFIRKPFRGNTTFRFGGTGFEIPIIPAGQSKVSFLGSVTAESGEVKQFEIKLKKQDGIWKVDNVYVYPL